MRIHLKKDKLSALSKSHHILDIKLKNSKVVDHLSEKEKNINGDFQRTKEENIDESPKKNNLFVVRSFNLQAKERKEEKRSRARRRGSLYLLSPLKKQNLFEQAKENLNKSLVIDR